MSVVRSVPEFAAWQRKTRDPADTKAVNRCALRSERIAGGPRGICLRKKGHDDDWHEGRSIDGNFVAWRVEPPKQRRGI